MKKICHRLPLPSESQPNQRGVVKGIKWSIKDVMIEINPNMPKITWPPPTSSLLPKCFPRWCSFCLHFIVNVTGAHFHLEGYYARFSIFTKKPQSMFF